MPETLNAKAHCSVLLEYIKRQHNSSVILLPMIIDTGVTALLYFNCKPLLVYTRGVITVLLSVRVMYNSNGYNYCRSGTVRLNLPEL